ncbi:MAG TPA: hypothetical protein VEB20_06390 [Azospirillaceae bacterium]|nr:hypothetical protein [Azospirillaceae bacterium]
MRRLLAVLAVAVPASAAAAEPCPFDAAAMAFAGTPAEQAACLLRPVGRWGRVGEVRPLPPFLAGLLAEGRVAVDAARLSAYLARQGIDPADIGGDPAGALSRTADGLPARYFVIHDTAAPNRKARPFGPAIDGEAWNDRQLGYYRTAPKVAHLFIDRLGRSIAQHGFSVPWRATKAEGRMGVRARGRFLHVELIQPRRSAPDGPEGNFALAPEPGFTPAQLRRLALAYVAAAVRGGAWPVPAFHAVLDAGIPEAHDDPQNFDLAAWSAALEALLAEIASGPVSPSGPVPAAAPPA